MTLQALTQIIIDTIDKTEEDILRYKDMTARLVSVTIQVMDVLKGISIEMNTRDLKYALLVQEIVGKIRAKYE